MLVFISTTAARGFWRCGKFFPKEGVLVDLADFTEEEHERLENEPMLWFSQPTDDQMKSAKAGGAEGEAELRHDLAEVIRSLSVEDFQKDGKPKMDALKTLMPKSAKFNAGLRDKVWDALIEDGFTAPAAEE